MVSIVNNDNIAGSKLPVRIVLTDQNEWATGIFMKLLLFIVLFIGHQNF